MTCTPIRNNTTGMTVGFICGPRKRPQKCRFCKDGLGVRLCDGPGEEPGTTCDKPLCERCARRVGRNTDFCPAHAPRVHIQTARISYGGPDRLDITRKGADAVSAAEGVPPGRIFAPSWRILGAALEARKEGTLADIWPSYVADYTDEMRQSYREHYAEWNAVLHRERVVLVCYCTDRGKCHRRILAEILAKLGAVDEGELT